MRLFHRNAILEAHVHVTLSDSRILYQFLQRPPLCLVPSGASWAKIAADSCSSRNGSIASGSRREHGQGTELCATNGSFPTRMQSFVISRAHWKMQHCIILDRIFEARFIMSLAVVMPLPRELHALFGERRLVAAVRTIRPSISLQQNNPTLCSAN